MDNKIFDNIVIGTGIGGLTAGLDLAKKGHSVLLLEAGKQFGGMLNPFARRKYHFDVGIHYVGEAGPKQAMRRILDSLGLDEIQFREINPDCIDRYVFDGYEVPLVKGIDRWGDILCEDFPKERDAIRKFLELMKACGNLNRMFMKGLSWKPLSRALGFAPDLVRVVRAPFSDLLERYFNDPLLRNAFAGPGGDIGLPPSRASSFAMIMVLNHLLGGAYYPMGGSGAMRDAYVSALKAHGAELLRNQLVTQIKALSGGRFVVTTAKDDRFESRSVISNADATQTLDLIEGITPSRSFTRKASQFKPSLGSFCVFVGTDLDLNKTQVTDANIWHYGTNDLETGYAQARSGQLPEDPFFFLTAPTLKDPESKRAPAGHHTVEMLTFVPTAPFRPYFDKPAMRRGEEYERTKNEYTDRLLERAELYTPGLRDHIIVKEAATPATVWHFVRGRDGGIYGPDHTPDQMLLGRLRPNSAGIEGLYLAGASVFGAGIMGCLGSGMVAARSCRRHLTGAGQSRLFSGFRKKK